MKPRIGILEGRMTGELASLITRQGGEPILAPALRETPIDASGPVAELIDTLRAGEIQVMIFLTGVGAAALFREAEGLGRLPELLGYLQSTVNVSRGQKPWKPLKAHGVPITHTVPDPYTTHELQQTLAEIDLEGRGVGLLHYGERNDVIADTLVTAGAKVTELCLYEWRMPEDVEPLRRLVDLAIGGDLEAVAFTSQVQVRHLMAVADEEGKVDALREALNNGVVVAAVGPTSAAALRDAGIAPRVEPKHPKMGPMVVALMEYLSAR